MTSEERGNYLENPPEDGPDIDKAHEVISVKAQIIHDHSQKESQFGSSVSFI